MNIEESNQLVSAIVGRYIARHPKAQPFADDLRQEARLAVANLGSGGVTDEKAYAATTVWNLLKQDPTGERKHSRATAAVKDRSHELWDYMGPQYSRQIRGTYSLLAISTELGVGIPAPRSITIDEAVDLERAWKWLTLSQSEVFRMLYSGFTQAEIAQTMRISQQAVSKLMQGAHQRLRERLIGPDWGVQPAAEKKLAA